MPIYEFKCQGCEVKFELLCSMRGADGVICPECGSDDVSRLFSTFFSRSSGSGGGSSSHSCSGCHGSNCSSCHH